MLNICSAVGCTFDVLLSSGNIIQEAETLLNSCVKMSFRVFSFFVTGLCAV